MANKIKRVGVVGAGVMGAGVAQALAQAGYEVLLMDIAGNALTQAEQTIRQNLRFHHMFKPDAPRQNVSEVMARITFTESLPAFDTVDFVVENVTEKWEVKQPIYEQLDEICPPHTLFAANTSCIPITQIAGVTNRPAQLLGIHFMNPVPLKEAAEMIRGYHTSDETIATALALLADMGIAGIVVNDSPGFVSNRVLMLTINEAVFLLQEGVAEAENVDKIFRDCFGHKMGPLETADLIGLDTILFSLEVLVEQFNDSKFRPCPLLRKMVNAGNYGRKTGEGFYQYNNS